MAGDPRVLGLLEEMLDAGKTPDEVCRGCPELLAEVREQWREFRRLDAAVVELPPGLRTAPYVGAVKPLPAVADLNDYSAALAAKGNTEEHVRLSVSRVRAVLDGCGFKRLDHLDSVRAAEWLADLRKDAAPVTIPPGCDTFTPAQVCGLLGIT